MKATNEFHNPIGAFRRKVDYNHEYRFQWKRRLVDETFNPGWSWHLLAVKLAGSLR